MSSFLSGRFSVYKNTADNKLKKKKKGFPRLKTLSMSNQFGLV